MNISAKLKKLKIGVLMGGSSSEREISLKSGEAVLSALQKLGLDVVGINVKKNPKKAISASGIDIAFIVLHGAGGEDGKIQTVLKGLKIPYVGCDEKASALAFNKWDAKQALEKSGIDTPKAFLINRRAYKSKLKTMVFPSFLKPLEEGSSIGVRLLNDRRTVEDEILEAFKDYDKLIVEEKIFGKELTIGILGNKALPIVELDTKNSFFDFEAKYKKGITKYYVEPDIPEDKYKAYQAYALKAFKALNGRDFGRVDLMVDTFGTPFVLEINTIPGFTEQSLLPMAAHKAGISFPELCVKILELALKHK